MANDNAALVRHEAPRAMVRRDESAGFTESEVDLIKTQIAPGVTDGELKLFLHVCKSRQLDPFSKQIYAVVRKQWNADTRTEEKKMVMMTAIDGFRLNARRAGVEAIDEPEFEYDARLISNSNPIGLVKATVKVWRKGVDRPTVGVAYWDEYVQTKRDGSPSGQWPKMPRTMLGKCAEAQGLRKAAPEELSGLYAPEEMDQMDSERRVLAPPSQERVSVAAVVESRIVADEFRPTAEFSKSPAVILAARLNQATNPRELAAVAADIKRASIDDAERAFLRDLYSERQKALRPAPVVVAEADAAPEPGSEG